MQGNLNEKFDIDTPDKNAGRANIKAGSRSTQRESSFGLAGQNFDALKKEAATATSNRCPSTSRHRWRSEPAAQIDSRNVIAKLEGSDPQLKDEYVVYSAHWDHLGVGDPVNGDHIFNGALDNASGVATVLEIAKSYSGSILSRNARSSFSW